MTKEQKDWQASLKLAQEALNETDETKHPKLHATRKELVDTLQYNENMRIRAEKAERVNKPEKPVETITPKKEVETETPKNPDLKEVVATTKALHDVHEDDVDAIMEWAKFKGISIPEAKKEPHIQSLLKTNEEERKTANATSTGKGKRGVTKKSIKAITDKANEYKDLDTDEDYEKLADARLKKQEQSR